MAPTTPDIAVARAQEADQVLALQRLCYRSEADLYGDYKIPPLTESLEDLRRQVETHAFLVARLGEEVVGSVRALQEAGTCHVGRLVVHPKLQGQGLGTRLMREIEARFPDAESYELFTGHLSADNLRLYGKLGYTRFREKRISPRLCLIYLEKHRWNT